MGRGKLSPEDTELVRRVGAMFYIDGWSTHAIAEELGISQKAVVLANRRARDWYARRGLAIVQQAKAIIADQLIEVSRKALRNFEKNGDTEQAALLLEAYRTLAKEDVAPGERGINVNVQANAAAAAQTVVEVVETEDWYGEHGAKAHASGRPDHASFTEAVTAHQRRLAERSTVQDGLLRAPVGQDGDEHASHIEGPRPDEGILAGGTEQAERPIFVDGDDTRPSEACYLGVDSEGNPVYSIEEE